MAVLQAKYANISKNFKYLPLLLFVSEAIHSGTMVTPKQRVSFFPLVLKKLSIFFISPIKPSITALYPG